MWMSIEQSPARADALDEPLTKRWLKEMRICLCTIKQDLYGDVVPPVLKVGVSLYANRELLSDDRFNIFRNDFEGRMFVSILVVAVMVLLDSLAIHHKSHSQTCARSSVHVASNVRVLCVV